MADSSMPASRTQLRGPSISALSCFTWAVRRKRKPRGRNAAIFNIWCYKSKMVRDWVRKGRNHQSEYRSQKKLDGLKDYLLLGAKRIETWHASMLAILLFQRRTYSSSGHWEVTASYPFRRTTSRAGKHMLQMCCDNYWTKGQPCFSSAMLCRWR